jgi:hypothetical protein
MTDRWNIWTGITHMYHTHEAQYKNYNIHNNLYRYSSLRAKTKLNSVPRVHGWTKPAERLSLSAKLLPMFVDRGCHVVSVTGLYGASWFVLVEQVICMFQGHYTIPFLGNVQICFFKVNNYKHNLFIVIQHNNYYNKHQGVLYCTRQLLQVMQQTLN